MRRSAACRLPMAGCRKLVEGGFVDRFRGFWLWFDQLSDLKKIAAGSAFALFLFASWLYSLGFLGLAASTRHVEAAKMPTPTTAAAVTPSPSASLPTATAEPTRRLAPTVAPEPTSAIYRPVAPTPTRKPAVEPPVRHAALPTRTPTSRPYREASPTATPEVVRRTETPGAASKPLPTPTYPVPMLVTPGLPPATTTPEGTTPTATPIPAAATPTPVLPPAAPTPTPSH